MKRPWQIWVVFLLCLAFVLPAMGWLTVKALQLDRARLESTERLREAHRLEAESRRQADLVREEAELEEQISAALWRMDWTLTPLVAQEAARPFFVYDSFYEIPNGKSKQSAMISPLAIQPSSYVRLHFQLRVNGDWTSPQFPEVARQEEAIANGVSGDNILDSGRRLEQLKDLVDCDALLAALPDEFNPAFQVSKAPWAGNVTLNTNDPEQPQVAQAEQQFQLQTPANDERFQRANPPAFEEENPLDLDQANLPPLDRLTQERREAQTRLQMRGGKEFANRGRFVQNTYNNSHRSQRVNFGLYELSTEAANEGVSRPVWLGDQLLLARRVVRDGELWVQGCWLDWEAIRSLLLTEVADLFPEAELLPLHEDNEVPLGRQLASLPAYLAIVPMLRTQQPSNEMSPVAASTTAPLSPMQLSLLMGWICLIIAAGAAAVLLRGVVALSERRGAFVSAVTHELRTPLTTFRMYAEMLSEGMVAKEEQRQRYLDTLRVEADRLSHLVENVLSYARLERGGPGKRREEVSVASLLDKIETRLVDRALQAEMQFVVQADEASRKTVLRTDPSAVEQILFNLVNNACKYASAAEDRRIQLTIEPAGGQLAFRLRDYGPGIQSHESKRLFLPFSKSADEAAHTAPGVGLGLALCQRLTSALDGQLQLEQPSEGGGALFVLKLPVQVAA